MWEKLQGRMITACDNFAKSAEACRKKWKAVYKQYCTDKRILQVSGEGRKVTCRFFEEIDQGFNNLANVRKLCHGDARGTPNPFPPDLNEGVESAHESAEKGTTSEMNSAGIVPQEVSPQGSKVTKKSHAEQISLFMTDMVSQTKEMVHQTSAMVQQTTAIAHDIHQNAETLKELKCQFALLIDKL